MKNKIRSIFYALIDVARYAKITLLEIVRAGTTESFATSRLKNIHLIEALVDGAYLTIVDRAPDPQGRTAFTTALTSGAITPRAVLSELMRSPESVYERLRSDVYVAKVELFERLVEGAFLNILGREADIDGRNAYVGALMSGSLTPADMLSELSGSSESVYERLRSDLNADKIRLVEHLVEGAFLNILGRAADIADRNAYVGELMRGALTPGAMLSELSSSSESLIEQHRKRMFDEYRARSISDKVGIYEAFVEGIYLRIMGRAPDIGSKNAFVAELVNDRLAPGDMIKELMGSAEYSSHILEEPIIVCTVIEALSAALWKRYINDTDLLDISERVKRGEKFTAALSNLEFSSEISTLALIGLTMSEHSKNQPIYPSSKSILAGPQAT